jgi:hypothetical protein
MAGAEAGWRVVVHIGSGQPELQAALSALPARARAERLRQLALVGLYSLRCGPPAAVPASEPHSEANVAITARRERLLQGLLHETD